MWEKKENWFQKNNGGFMKIYFGHSRMTYDTPAEREAIKIIRLYYPEPIEIVNPNTPEHQTNCLKDIDDPSKGKEIHYFLRLCNDCAVGTFLQYYPDKWSAGSAAEANHMLNSLGRPVLRVNLALSFLSPVTKLVQAYSFEETYDMLAQSSIKGYEKRR